MVLYVRTAVYVWTTAYVRNTVYKVVRNAYNVQGTKKNGERTTYHAQSTAYNVQSTTYQVQSKRTMTKVPHILLEAHRIMFRVQRIMLKSLFIMLKSPCIMLKSPCIMLKSPSKMVFDHLRQLWLSIQRSVKVSVNYQSNWRCHSPQLEYLKYITTELSALYIMIYYPGYQRQYLLKSLHRSLIFNMNVSIWASIASGTQGNERLEKI